MINPRTIAQEIAYADVATQAANLQEKQSELDAESSGLDSLSSALSDFQSAVDALNSDTDGPVTFAATSNNDSATVSANSQAQAGSYSFFVEQLAQGQQTTFSMGDDAFSATGTFELTMGGSTMDIDLSAADQNGDGDGFIDASELVNAINDSDDNPGVSAALLDWPMSTIQLSGTDEQTLIAEASRILDAWRGYSDAQCGIFAETDGTPHNTITPILRKEGEQYRLWRCVEKFAAKEHQAIEADLAAYGAAAHPGGHAA